MLEHLKQDLPLLQYAHLLWGFALFLALAVWAYWPSRRDSMRHYGESILDDDAKRGQNVGKH